MNWGELGDGQHTAVVYDDGIEFDRSTFHVVTTGEAFLVGAAGQCVVSDFPAPNENARFIWNQPTQHLELAEVGGAELLPLVEECEETTCPVCEVCRECPPGTSSTPFDGRWEVSLTGSCGGARDMGGFFQHTEPSGSPYRYRGVVRDGDMGHQLWRCLGLWRGGRDDDQRLG